ncbi:hypothetical protein ACFPVY_10950 [Flavobacterium qiangtangense]|uniref:Alpha-ketoglutarate decarboxylase n=1 Tax=Flavobacterium qiangtangense TaxID=1442595 RepID=A0ABW1PNE7_9FLAO
MKVRILNHITKIVFVVSLFVFSDSVKAQENEYTDFWSRVHFGGGLGIGFGSNYTNIALAPSAIYDFNQYISAGIALQGSYVRDKNFYESYMYGPSLIVLGNPIPQIQLSAELEQLRVNVDYDDGLGFPNDNFWNTALFLGAGYRTNNVTIGVRYNVLHDSDKNVYSDAFMPFVRVYF